MVINNILTDVIYKSYEWWMVDYENLNQVLDEIFKLSKKYKEPLIFTSAPVKLEKCRHTSCSGCIGFIDTFISSEDYSRILSNEQKTS